MKDSEAPSERHRRSLSACPPCAAQRPRLPGIGHDVLEGAVWAEVGLAESPRCAKSRGAENSESHKSGQGLTEVDSEKQNSTDKHLEFFFVIFITFLEANGDHRRSRCNHS